MNKNNAMKRFRTKLPWLLAVGVVGVMLVYGFWPEPVSVDLVEPSLRWREPETATSSVAATEEGWLQHVLV